MTLTGIVFFIAETLLTRPTEGGASLNVGSLASVNVSPYNSGSQPLSLGPGEMAEAPRKRFRRRGRLLGLSLATKACTVNQCKNNGKCTANIQEVGGFICNCPVGYFGAICDVVTPDCESSPCLHGAVCVVTDTGFRCDCKPGYSGIICEFDDAGDVIPPKGSKSNFTITIVCVVMAAMVVIGLFLLLVERQRERLKSFNREYKGGVQFRTGTIAVLFVMCSELREFICGHSERARGSKRKGSLSKRVRTLKKHEREKKKVGNKNKDKKNKDKKIKDKKIKDTWIEDEDSDEESEE